MGAAVPLPCDALRCLCTPGSVCLHAPSRIRIPNPIPELSVGLSLSGLRRADSETLSTLYNISRRLKLMSFFMCPLSHFGSKRVPCRTLPPQKPGPRAQNESPQRWQCASIATAGCAARVQRSTVSSIFSPTSPSRAQTSRASARTPSQSQEHFILRMLKLNDTPRPFARARARRHTAWCGARSRGATSRHGSMYFRIGTCLHFWIQGG